MPSKSDDKKPDSYLGIESNRKHTSIQKKSNQYRLEGFVSTCLLRPDKQWISGSILGNDGKYYRYGVPLRLKAIVEEGNRVSFVPKAGDKCYFAKEITPVKIDKQTYYTFPEEVINIREKAPKGMIVLKTFDVYVVGAARGDPADVIQGIKNLVKEIGANGFKDMKRFSTTESESGTGSGIHYYTVHNIYVKPCLIGIPTETGGESPKERISKINETIEKTFENNLEQWKKQQKRINILWGLTLLAFIFAGYLVTKGGDKGILVIPAGLLILAVIESIPKTEPFRLSSTPPSNED